MAEGISNDDSMRNIRCQVTPFASAVGRNAKRFRHNAVHTMADYPLGTRLTNEASSKSTMSAPAGSPVGRAVPEKINGEHHQE